MALTSLPPTCLRFAVMIVGITFLAGCQTHYYFGDHPEEKFPPLGNSATGDSDSTADNTGDNGEAIGLDRAAVKRLQARLKKLGFRPGPIDGIVGQETTGAIRQFQRAHGLPVTGKISTRLLKVLETASARGKRHAREEHHVQTQVNLAPEDLPTYRTGTTFIYSNGVVERVSGVKDATVHWARNDGESYSASRNFLLPWSYWSSGHDRGKATVSEAADTLWPRREGASVVFSAKVVSQRKDNVDVTERRVDRWRCRNDGQRDVTVPAGTFETVVLVCRRLTNEDSPGLIKTWYYAKSIRHYVRFVESDTQRDTTTKVDLVAVRPSAPGWPPIVRAALARAIVHTLDIKENEAQMPWTSSAVNTRVTIQAKPRFVGHDGVSCRRFMQIWSDDGGRRNYPAVACRTGVETWEIPGLETSTDISLEPAGKTS